MWTFTRGVATLAISRQALDDGMVLSIAGDGSPRSYFFTELERLDTFQRDMETLLLKTGWTFVSYSPQRRRGRDRRGWPRVANDRRRWWTDGTAPEQGSARADRSERPDRRHASARSSEK